MSRTVVYLSGPITLGDRSHNLAQFMQAHEILMDAGFAVINPGLSALIPWAWAKPHADWIASDLPIVERCDWVVRLPGESAGADMETEHAKKCGIPVLFVETVKMLERIEYAGRHQRVLPAGGGGSQDVAGVETEHPSRQQQTSMGPTQETSHVGEHVRRGISDESWTDKAAI